MYFSSTTGKDGIIQLTESYLNLPDGAITGDTTLFKQITEVTNRVCYHILTLILQAQDESDFDDKNFSTYPINTTDLIANQRDYSIVNTGSPQTEIVALKRVEVTYDGVNWYRARPIDINEIENATDTTNLALNFNTTNPRYDVQYGSIFLYPTPTQNVTGGLKIWGTRELDPFTTSDTTQEPAFDEAFHEMVPVGNAYRYARSKGLPMKEDLKKDWEDGEKRIKAYYGTKEKDREYSFTTPYQDLS